MKEQIREIKEAIIWSEGLILAAIALILIILHHLGLLNYVVSISTILILLSLLVIHETLKSLKDEDSIKEIKNTLKEIQERQKHSEILDKAYEAGFRQIYKQREDFIHYALYSKIELSKRFTAVIAICLTMLREVVLYEKYVDLIVDKIAKNSGYRFEFFVLKTDLYEKRAEIEDSDPNILKIYRHISLLNLLWIKSKIYYKTKNIKNIERVKIYEYVIMPTISEFLVDDTVFYGPYIARKCGDIPIVEIEGISETSRTDTSKTLHDLFYYHYKRIKELSIPLKIYIDDEERDFDSVLSEKMENGKYKIERIYDILSNENKREEYYNQIMNQQKTFEDILKGIELKIRSS
jgi:hypothetical protein